MGEAMQWVARIMAVAIEMVLPGLAGQWLDKRIGTSCFALAGFAVGITLGIWHLLVMTRARQKNRLRDAADIEKRKLEDL